MTPKKGELLDVLRKQGDRPSTPAGAGGEQRALPPSRRPLPPWLGLAFAALVLIGGIWGVTKLLGPGDDGSRYAVLAASWSGADQEGIARERALEVVRMLRVENPREYVHLRRIANGDEVRWDLYVGPEPAEADLGPILDALKTVELPPSSGEHPFAGAVVANFPESDS